MRLELWLDESGDFISDFKPNLNPSLVGGVLTPAATINEQYAKKIIGKDYVHFNQEQGELNVRILEAVKSNGGEFVIFQNKERLRIIDSDTTYLNVLAEGLIQLLLHLSAIYGDFELDILVATRKNLEKGFGIISSEEYEKRLKERIILGLARKALTTKNKWRYNINFDDARTSFRLMLADGVCNTYLTRTSAKFNASEKNRIEELFDQQFLFSFFENSVEQEFQRWLVEGNLSDVIFESFMDHDVTNQDLYLDIALKRLQDLDEYGQRLQLHSVSSRVETFIKIDRNYEIIRPVLIKMQEELLLKLEELNIHVPEFNLDIILYLYSLYTHEGSIKAEEQDQMFIQNLALVDDMMTKLKYFNIYKVRKGVHQKNMLNVLDSINDLSKAISVFEEMIEILTILEEDISIKGNSSMFETLGKAYGTRGQGYTMLIHEDPEFLNKSISDFDHALMHFSLETDKERQYVYKCLAYCEGGNFERSLYFLYKSCHLDREPNGFNQLLNSLKTKHVSKVIFKYHCYFKVMAQAKVLGADGLADQMYDALNQEKISIDSLQSKNKYPHPMQFMYWNMATYLFLKGKQKLAMKYLEHAIDLCDSPLSGATLKIIQLGMYSEKILILQKIGKKIESEQVKKELVKRYNELKKLPNVDSMVDYLQEIDSLDEQRLKTIIQLTKCIN